MKVNKIGRISKWSGYIQLVNYHGTQWVGSAAALYLLEGLPEFDEDSILTLFDIPEKDRDKYAVQKKDNEAISDSVNLSDTDDSEKIVDKLKTGILYGGNTYLALKSDSGIIFINSVYLSPFNDKEDQYELYERKGQGGTSCIAVKEGFMIKGLIMPYSLKGDQKAVELYDMWKQVKENTEEESGL